MSLYNISQSEIVPFNQQQMFNLVLDVDNYHNFLNWCSHSQVINYDNDIQTASMSINKGIFKQIIITKNTFEKNKNNSFIKIELQKGPFKELEGLWQFTNINKNSCNIQFDIKFSFINKILDFSLRPIFITINKSQINSFIKQAHRIYS